MRWERKDSTYNHVIQYLVGNKKMIRQTQQSTSARHRLHKDVTALPYSLSFGDSQIHNFTYRAKIKRDINDMYKLPDASFWLCLYKLYRLISTLLIQTYVQLLPWLIIHYSPPSINTFPLYASNMQPLTLCMHRLHGYSSLIISIVSAHTPTL